MKLLYIANGYKPQRWAGTETYTAGIAEEMSRRGHDVSVLCIGDWERGDAYWNGVSLDVQNGVPVRRVNLNWAKAPDPSGYLYDNPIVAEYLRNLLVEIKPDVVHITSCETLSASVIRAVKAMNVPSILSLTDFWFLCPRVNLLHADGSNCSGQTSAAQCLDCKMRDNRTYRRLLNIVPEGLLFPTLETVSRFPALTRHRGLRGLAGNISERKSKLKHALSLPDRIVTASQFVKDVFMTNDVAASITVQAYGHDLSWLQSYHGKVESRKIRLGYVGQLIEAKGVHLILQALNELPTNLKDMFSLEIYGNLNHTPAYGQRLKDLAANFSNVTFAGTYPHSESADVFARIDALLVPSVWYDFPLIIHEAFATGTPVIATNLGGMAEVVTHGINGLLFERANVSDLAHQISRILSEPGLLDQLSRGVPRVRTVKDEADALEQSYIEISRAKKEEKLQEN